MSKLFIPVGIPGCGKSTLAERVLNNRHLHIHETDSIRQELHPGVEFDAAFNEQVFGIYHGRIEASLMKDYDVFADATNLQHFARDTLGDIAELTDAETHLIVFTNLSAAVFRNLKRDRVVPSDVMVRMLTQYEKAMRDIPTEDYTSVTYIEGVS